MGKYPNFRVGNKKVPFFKDVTINQGNLQTSWWYLLQKLLVAASYSKPHGRCTGAVRSASPYVYSNRFEGGVIAEAAAD